MSAPTKMASIAASAIRSDWSPLAAKGMIAAATSGDTAESGPSTRIRDGPSRKYTTSGTTVAYRPVTGGTPASWAYAIPCGTSSAARTVPAITSLRSAAPRWWRTSAIPGTHRPRARRRFTSLPAPRRLQQASVPSTSSSNLPERTSASSIPLPGAPSTKDTSGCRREGPPQSPPPCSRRAACSPGSTLSSTSESSAGSSRRSSSSRRARSGRTSSTRGCAARAWPVNETHPSVRGRVRRRHPPSVQNRSSGCGRSRARRCSGRCTASHRGPRMRSSRIAACSSGLRARTGRPSSCSMLLRRAEVARLLERVGGQS